MPRFTQDYINTQVKIQIEMLPKKRISFSLNCKLENKMHMIEGSIAIAMHETTERNNCESNKEYMQCQTT